MAFGPNTVIGRQLLGEVSDVATVQPAAEKVTTEVQKSIGGGKAKLTPAAIIGSGRIIVGFVPEGTFQARSADRMEQAGRRRPTLIERSRRHPTP